MTYYSVETEKYFVFLTNNFSVAPLTVATLYRHRWRIELFFKWIKQHLRIKRFFGTSTNSVKTQIWIGVSVYVLIAIIKKQLGLKESLYTILQILSLSLFEKTPILSLFEDYDEQVQTSKRVEYPSGTLNDKGEVAFTSNTSNLYTEQDGGIYSYSGGHIQKVMLVSEPTPIGGKFAPFRKADEFYPAPRLNNNSAIAFKAAVKGGNSPVAIFLASPRALLKVVGVGDRLPTGETISGIDTFALNDLGQIAFFALDKNNKTLGVFKASPVAPLIEIVEAETQAWRTRTACDWQSHDHQRHSHRNQRRGAHCPRLSF